MNVKIGMRAIAVFYFLIAGLFGFFVLLFLGFPPKEPISLLLIVAVLFFVFVCYFCVKLGLGLWNVKQKAQKIVLALHLILLLGALLNIFIINMPWQNHIFSIVSNGMIVYYLFRCNSLWASEASEKGLSYET